MSPEKWRVHARGGANARLETEEASRSHGRVKDARAALLPLAFGVGGWGGGGFGLARIGFFWGG